MIHIETVQVSSSRIVQTERLQVPFFGLIWVVASRYMPPFETDTHFININILITFEKTTESRRENVE
jgi:hypothetical protein